MRRRRRCARGHDDRDSAGTALPAHLGCLLARRVADAGASAQPLCVHGGEAAACADDGAVSGGGFEWPPFTASGSCERVAGRHAALGAPQPRDLCHPSQDSHGRRAVAAAAATAGAAASQLQCSVSRFARRRPGSSSGAAAVTGAAVRIAVSARAGGRREGLRCQPGVGGCGGRRAAVAKHHDRRHAARGGCRFAPSLGTSGAVVSGAAAPRTAQLRRSGGRGGRQHRAQCTDKRTAAADSERGGTPILAPRARLCGGWAVAAAAAAAIIAVARGCSVPGVILLTTCSRTGTRRRARQPALPGAAGGSGARSGGCARTRGAPHAHSRHRCRRQSARRPADERRSPAAHPAASSRQRAVVRLSGESSRRRERGQRKGGQRRVCATRSGHGAGGDAAGSPPVAARTFAAEGVHHLPLV